MSSAGASLPEIVITLSPSLAPPFLGYYEDHGLKFLDCSVFQGHQNKYTVPFLSSIHVKLFYISSGTKLNF